jgi:nicotinamide-nucleotide amidase
MNPPLLSIHALATHLGQLLLQKQWRLVTAESCTGGSLSAVITDIPGCSEWFDCGFITYSNLAKTHCLGVPAADIAHHGAVSENIAIAMAEGALQQAMPAHLSIAITGIAGPNGGRDDKPVGTVWIACGRRGQATVSQLHHLSGNRPAIRHQAVFAALELLIEHCR